MKDILYIVMPAYNEEEAIAEVVADWYPKVLRGGAESRLVIADSGSTDRTHAILEELQKKYCQIEILSQTKKEHGAKLMALYAYAVGQGADYIFQTDSDGQTRAEEFETFWQLKDRYEAVLGMRKKRGDGFSRMFVEKTLCRILRVCFGVVIPDANAPFRLMRASLVQKYLCRLPEDYNLPNVMLTTYFVYFRENIDFHEISFQARTKGRNSINLHKIVTIGWRAVLEFRRLRKGMDLYTDSN